RTEAIVQLAFGVGAGAAAFLTAARLLRMTELKDLLAAGRASDETEPPPPQPLDSDSPAR
ncbi:MAG TPA: hypothetical protein VM238_00515, partial [Phycisphaerae bacterium]|nr:hypothetical protein [Phycisphaerae bacterium]